MAYLEPEREEVPLGVRQALRDAHARLGGTACGAKEVFWLRGDPAGWSGWCISASVDGSGALVDTPPRLLAHEVSSLLRQARMAGAPLFMACRDAEALLRAGVPGPSSTATFELEACVWRLEGLGWRQRMEQRRREEEGEGARRWERRGAAGRRGRRRREFGVVFELGPWGEACRAASHEEAAWVRLNALYPGDD